MQNIKTMQYLISKYWKLDQMRVNVEIKEIFSAWACNLLHKHLPVQSQGQKH